MRAILLIQFLLVYTPSIAQLVGERTHQQLSKNRSLETSLYMLHQWADTLDLSRESRLAEIAYSIFSSEKEAGFDKLVSDQDYLAWVGEEETLLLGGPVWGHVTQEGADL